MDNPGDGLQRFHGVCPLGMLIPPAVGQETTSAGRVFLFKKVFC